MERDIEALLRRADQADRTAALLSPTTATPTARSARTTRGVVIPDSTIDRLTTYMAALTDPRARDLRLVAPQRVPSGLPVD